MRTSACLVAAALVLLAAQVIWSPGDSGPWVGPLGAAMLPVTLGLILLVIGLAWGFVVGTAAYRIAVVAATLGSALIAVALMLLTIGGYAPRSGPSINEIALAVGAGLWVVALVQGQRALRMRV